MSISVVSYTEEPQARSTTLDAQGNRVLSRKWLARLNINAATPTEINQLESYVEQQTPVVWYEAHPAIPAARANSFKASPINGDLSQWTVEVGYTTNFRQQQPARGDGSGGTITSGTTAGPSSPSTTADNQADADQRPPEITVSTVRYQKICETDTGGNKIVNSANDRYDPPIEREAARLQFQFKFWRSPSWLSLSYFGYIDTLNNATCTIMGCDFPLRTLRCTSITMNGVWEKKTVLGVAQQSFFWEVTTTLEYDPDTWRAHVLDAGKRELVSGKYVPITANGAIVTEPVPLDGSGRKLAPTGTPVYTDWNIYRSVSYAGIMG